MSIEPPHEDDSAVRSAPYTLEQTLSGVVMGLNPSQGDEIIQIGAARIVNNKLIKP